jgi:hypothetical protein
VRSRARGDGRVRRPVLRESRTQAQGKWFRWPKGRPESDQCPPFRDPAAYVVSVPRGVPSSGHDPSCGLKGGVPTSPFQGVGPVGIAPPDLPAGLSAVLVPKKPATSAVRGFCPGADPGSARHEWQRRVCSLRLAGLTHFVAETWRQRRITVGCETGCRPILPFDFPGRKIILR